jgi:hypothetical protein
VRRFNRGVFYIRLTKRTDGAMQPIAVGIDPGSKWEGFTVKSASHTYLNVHADAVTWVSKAVEQKRQMRRARRFRKTPCRANRKNRVRDGIPPSTKARWQWKLRLSQWLAKIYPVSQFVVEDIKNQTKPGKGSDARHWNSNFSPLMIGKRWFYSELEKLAPGIRWASRRRTRRARRCLNRTAWIRGRWRMPARAVIPDQTTHVCCWSHRYDCIGDNSTPCNRTLAGIGGRMAEREALDSSAAQ